MTAWDEQKIESLRTLWESGMTAAQCAKELNMTRNSVIGKSYRLGLGSNKVACSKEEQAAELAEKKKRQRAADARRQAVRRAAAIALRPTAIAPRPKAPILMEVAPMVESLRIPLLDLKPDHCRWPTNDDMQNAEFCGHPVDAGHKSYCSHHRFRASARSQIACAEVEPVPVIRNRSAFGDLKVA